MPRTAKVNLGNEDSPNLRSRYVIKVMFHFVELNIKDSHQSIICEPRKSSYRWKLDRVIPLSLRGGKFLKRLWCCVGTVGGIQDTLVLLTGFHITSGKELKKVLTIASLCCIILLIGSINKLYQNLRSLYIYLSVIDQVSPFGQNLFQVEIPQSSYVRKIRKLEAFVVFAYKNDVIG